MATPRRTSATAKLTEQNVRDIKRRLGRNPAGNRYDFRGWSYGELAAEFHVSHALIAQIAQGCAWADIEVESDFAEVA